MRLLGVNVGQAQTIQNAKASGKTGIYKLPASEPAWVSSGGLARDAICDTENHGGVDQAVYIFGALDYDWWSEELGRELSPGTFGENFTISDLETAEVCIGDRFHIGEVVLEVTAPRIPCVTLAARMGDPAFVKRFRGAERPGLYCRVIQEGWAQAGDVVEARRHDGIRVTAIEIFRDFFAPDESEATIRRHLAAPIAVRARMEKEKELGELLAHRNRAAQTALFEEGG